MTALTVTSSPIATVLRRLFPWAMFLGLGAFVYEHTAHELEYNLFPFTVLLTVMLVGLGSGTLASNARKRWAWLLVPYVCCLFMYSTAIISAAKLKHSPTRDLTHQFGLRAVVFFFIIFVWIIVAPVKVSREANASLRKLQISVAVAVAVVQVFFTVQFLRELWFATSIDQVRASIKMLLYTGTALYLFLTAKMLLPRTVLGNHVTFANKQSNCDANSFGS